MPSRWLQLAAIWQHAILGRLVACRSLALGYLAPQSADSWQVELFSQFKLGILDVNAHPDILPNTTLRYIVRDTAPEGANRLSPGGVVGNEMQALIGAIELIAEGVVGILGTAYSSAITFPAGHASLKQRPMISPSSTAVGPSDKTRFPFLMRSTPNDALGIKSMVIVPWDLGWREVAVIVHVDYSDGFTKVMRPALESLGIAYLSLDHQSPSDEAKLAQLGQVMQVVGSAGYRVTLLYTFRTLLSELNVVTADFGLRTELHSWVIYNPSGGEVFFEEWGATPDANIVVVPKSSGSVNPVQDAYIARWPTVSVKYDSSVHGAFNVTTHDPFFGSTINDPIVWDTGDGLPAYWGQFAYDTVWLYARALHALEVRGVDPLADGAALRAELLVQNFTGVSGLQVSFDQDTQDRLQELQVHLLRTALERPILAEVTPRLSQTSVTDSDWCVTGCTTLGETGLDWIPWPSGKQPGDGRALDHQQSTFFSPTSFEEESPLEVTVNVRNSFQRPPCETACLLWALSDVDCQACLQGLVNYSMIEPHFRDAVSNATIQIAAPVVREVDYARGTLKLIAPLGLGGGGDHDRTVILDIIYDDQPFKEGGKSILLLSQSCQAGYRLTTDRQCEPCPLGTFSETKGSSSCTTCPVGTMQEAVGKTSCDDCTPGSFAEEPGMSSCELCANGYFQAEARQTGCTSCEEFLPGGSTTFFLGATSDDQCKCKAGYFFNKAAPEADPRCSTCPTGLSCREGTDPPLQAEGYHAGKQEFAGATPSFVVLCTNRYNCPGLTELHSCPPHREGVACEDCEVGYHEDGDGGCAPCDAGAVALPVLLCTAAGCLFIGLMFYIASRELSVTSQNVATVTIAGSLVVNSLQILGAFNELSLTWEEPMMSLRNFLSILVFRMSYINPGCTFQSNDQVALYVASLLLYPLVLLGLMLCFAIGRLLGRDHTSSSQLMNAIGLTMMVFYLSLAMAALLPLRCTANPDGTYSVVAHRGTLCWEGEHWTMVGFAVLAVLVYIVPFFSLVAYLTYVYPREIVRDGAKFVRRTEFLFKRYKSEYYFYGVIFLTRNLMIALVPVVFSVWPEIQVMAMMMIIVLTHSAMCRFCPWRTRLANVLDVIMSLALVAVLTAGAVITAFDVTRAVKIIQAIIVASLVWMAVAVLGVVFYSGKAFFWPEKHYGVFISRHRGSSQILARWFKLGLKEKTTADVFLDSDSSEELSTLLQILHVVAFETKNVVVLLTRQTLSRFWCACEIVAAHRARVRIILVCCDDTEPPSDIEIEELMDDWTEAQRAELASLGIGLDHMRDAYQALRDLPQLKFSHLQGGGVDDGIIEQVMKNCHGILPLVSTRSKTPRAGAAPRADAAPRMPTAETPRPEYTRIAQVLLAGNRSDPEASICAEVVKRMLMQTTQMATAIVGGDALLNLEEQIGGAKFFIALLSRGVLVNPEFAAALVTARAKSRMALIPIVADAGFHFPDAKFWADLRLGLEVDMSDPILQGVPVADVEEAYRSLFKVIALKFTEHGSETIQQAEMLAVKSRIDSKLNISIRSSRSLWRVGTIFW